MWLVVAVAALAAVANWWSRMPARSAPAGGDDRTRQRVEEITKPLVTIAIAALAVLVSADAATGVRIAAVVGFGLCLGGDVLLLPRLDRFIAGLVSFLSGHVAFAVMFVLLGLDAPLGAALAVAATGVLIATVGRRIVVAAAATTSALRTPVIAYLVVISAMAVLGWATGRPAAIVGTTLFVLSDSILGWNRFVHSEQWMAPAVMITYHGALVGLALTLA